MVGYLAVSGNTYYIPIALPPQISPHPLHQVVTAKLSPDVVKCPTVGQYHPQSRKALDYRIKLIVFNLAFNILRYLLPFDLS